MMNELQKLRELTETLTGNGYLKDQAEEWEYALNAIPDCVYIIDTKFKIKFINKVLVDKLNLEPHEICNKVCYDLIYGLTLDEVDEKLTERWLTEEDLVKINDVYIASLNGWFNISRSPIFTKQGKLLGFICILQNITAEKKARLELEEREQTLKSLFDSAPIGMGLIDKDTCLFLSVNRRLMEITGFSEKELVGSHFTILFKDLENFIEIPNKYSSIPTIETQIITKNDTSVDIYLRTSNVYDKSLLVFTVIDVTEKKKSEKLLALNEERLEATLALTKMINKSKEDIMKFALEEGVRLTNSTIGYLHLVNPKKEDEETQLKLFLWSSMVHDKCSAVIISKYSLSEAGCWADSVRLGVPVVHNDYKNFEGKKFLPEGHIDLINHMSVPVLDESGNVVVVAGVGNKDGDYNSSDIRQLSIFMNSMWDIIKNK